MALQCLGKGFLQGQVIITIIFSVCTAFCVPNLINPFCTTLLTWCWRQQLEHLLQENSPNLEHLILQQTRPQKGWEGPQEPAGSCCPSSHPNPSDLSLLPCSSCARFSGRPHNVPDMPFNTTQ